MKYEFAFTTFFITTLLIVGRSAAAGDISGEFLPEVLDERDSLRATMVCPFTVINGPKQIGTVVVNCYTDSACGTSSVGNAAWAGHGTPQTLINGAHRLSNDAMASAGLTALTTTQSIQLEVHDPGNTQVALLCMTATIVSGEFTCTGGGYTLNLNNL